MSFVWTGTFTSEGYEESNGTVSLLLPSDLKTFQNETEVHVAGLIVYTSSYKTNFRKTLHVVSKDSKTFSGFKGDQPITFVLDFSNPEQITGTYDMPPPEFDNGTVLLTKTDSDSLDLSEPQVKCCVM